MVNSLVASLIPIPPICLVENKFLFEPFLHLILLELPFLCSDRFFLLFPLIQMVRNGEAKCASRGPFPVIDEKTIAEDEMAKPKVLF